jgi:branched-subunit amino acid transport protein
MSVWLVIVLVGLGSYVFRVSMVLLIDRFDLPAWVGRASGFVAPAAFAALAAGAIATQSMSRDLLHAVPPLGAVAAAIVAVRLTGKSYMAVIAGMPVLWILIAVAGA